MNMRWWRRRRQEAQPPWWISGITTASNTGSFRITSISIATVPARMTWWQQIVSYLKVLYR